MTSTMSANGLPDVRRINFTACNCDGRSSVEIGGGAP